MAIHSVFLPRKSHGPRSLAGYSPEGCKELDMTAPEQNPLLKIQGHRRKGHPLWSLCLPLVFWVLIKFYLTAPGLSCGVWDLVP